MKLKTQPEDFYVEELIDLDVKDSGDYTYFWLTKKNWTTQRAISEIAHRCRATKRRFKFAGNKDKRAVTKQAVSAFKIEPELLKQINIKDIQIDVIGKGSEQISLGSLRGNRFKIVARELDSWAIKKLPQSARRIAHSGFPNYFGEQRFGKGNTHLIGKEIIKGNFERAVKYLLAHSGDEETEDASKARRFAKERFGEWKEILKQMPQFLGIEKAVLNHLVGLPNDFAGALRKIPKPIRKIYVHAYQSYLWNSAMEKTKAKGELKIPGYETKLGKSKFDLELKRLLEKEKVTLEDFKVARMPELKSEGTVREGVVKPEGLKYVLENDTVTIEFELTKGSYATVLLNQLFI